jgi:hypothetical protein
MTTDRNEAAVELEVLYPLLTQPGFLAVPTDAIKPKQYLPPTQLDKAAGRTSGYFPDFSIWLIGYPVAVVEAKDPSVSSETGFREGCLYARHLNARYTSGLNPCKFVIASNGITLLAGYWDQDKPVLQKNVDDLRIGTKDLDDLIAFCGFGVLQSLALEFHSKIKVPRGVRPFNLAGGQPLLNSKRELNSFAADLSPILRRYFSSTNQDNIREIAERAYVSSAEITEYDRVLEALLKDRMSPRRDTIVEPIRTSKSGEPLLTKAIQGFSEQDTRSGQLQIIQGAVGSGKSLFARRYRELLEPRELKDVNCWAFIDFGSSPVSLVGAEKWLCEAFIKSFERENDLVIYDATVLKGIFSRRIQQRRAYYEALRGLRNSNDEETRARATDIATWQADPLELTEGLANYLISIRKNLIVVMDNVDKMDLHNQLLAFQLTLWFMERTRAFTVLQMRDETYERYKNKKPLDTFRAGIAFHIAPPRFIDVIKRRLELGVEYLAAHAAEKQEYTLDNGARVILPKGDLGNFLHSLYSLLFGQRTNVARVLEALAGRDVRKALEMFVSIVTSGHLSTSAITSAVKGEGSIPITEFHILRILMRTDYRFFSDASGYTSNILYKKAVAGRFDLMAAKVCEIAPDRGVMIVEEITPATVAERGSFFSRADYVCKEYRGEHPIDPDSRSRAGQKLLDCIGNLFDVVADPGWMVSSWKLDIARAWNVLGEITSTLHVDGHVFGPVDDKGGHPDRGDNVTDVDLAVHPHEGGDGGRAGAKSLEAPPPFLGDWIIRERGREKGQAGTAAPSLINIAEKLCERLFRWEPGRKLRKAAIEHQRAAPVRVGGGE